jgi:16S rRNA G966 N2-methylase RsmD
MNGDKIDLIYTDPPYGINESGDRKGRGNENKSNTKIIAKGGSYKDFKDDTIDYAVKALEITEKLNIPRQIWWGANYYSHAIPQTNNWIIWDKRVEEKYSNTNGDCEMAYVKSRWSSIRIFRHLWMGLVKGSEHGQARVHPTQKPVALAEWCFDYYKEDFKNVIDLFTGSGTTLIACENKNKNAFCMEFETHYTQAIVQRYVDYTSNPMIKINGVEVDWYDYKNSATIQK